MAKRLLILSFLMAIAFPLAADFGIGVGAGCDFSTSPNSYLSASFRADTNPWCISVNAHFKEDFSSFKNALSVAADNWFVHARIDTHIDCYLLWGFSLAFAHDFDSADFAAAFGSRVGCGYDFFLFKRHAELFAQAVWDIAVGLKKEDGDCSFLFVPANFPCSVGIRLWR